MSEMSSNNRLTSGKSHKSLILFETNECVNIIEKSLEKCVSFPGTYLDLLYLQFYSVEAITALLYSLVLCVAEKAQGLKFEILNSNWYVP